MVYDLGGGTFDLAVLENEEGSFRVAMEPKGIDRYGGDGFDLALYYHCEEMARERLGRPISLNRAVDLKFLRQCRRRKESLSWRERARFSNYLTSDDGPVYFEHEVDRETFEGLIAPYVEETLLLRRQMLEEAGGQGHRAGGYGVDRGLHEGAAGGTDAGGDPPRRSPEVRQGGGSGCVGGGLLRREAVAFF